MSDANYLFIVTESKRL